MPERKTEESAEPDLIDTIKPADSPEDAAAQIEENGEPFEGNNA